MSIGLGCIEIMHLRFHNSPEKLRKFLLFTNNVWRHGCIKSNGIFPRLYKEIQGSCSHSRIVLFTREKYQKLIKFRSILKTRSFLYNPRLINLDHIMNLQTLAQLPTLGK